MFKGRFSVPPETPRSKTSFNPSTPVTSRITNSQAQSSPHYTTTRRHSLYGVEDRIVIDPGSLVWKVGFSGEGRPREVFYPNAKSILKGLWDLNRASDATQRAEEGRILDIKLEQSLRSVFHDSLLTDPKARKVIIIENPLLPLHIKEALARTLFENLQVPSVSFASSHLLSLLAVGRITGLVLDCGYLESVALPIFAARPLFSQLRSTPLAGQRFLSHLRSLLLLFGTYVAPTSPGANLPQASRSMRVPPEVLTNEVLEQIKTRCCFVGESLAPVEAVDHGPTPDDSVATSSDIDMPPSSDPAPSESEFSFAGRESGVSSQQDSSEFSVVSTPRMGGSGRTEERSGNENQAQALAEMYMRHSTATDLSLRVEPPASMANSSSLGYGTIIIPGWIRERTAEVLFVGGDVDEGSLAEVILDALLKVPVDLRKTLASSILIVGGTSMLLGFIPRLHVELLRALAPQTPPSSVSPNTSTTEPDKSSQTRPRYDHYASLRPLIPYISVVNNPSPPPPLSDRAKNNAGKAPAFSPATMAWVGGSLAGALKIGGTEVSREKWDEADPEREDPDASVAESTVRRAVAGSHGQSPPSRNVLPDWTRIPLASGAPPAASIATSSPMRTSGARARVGA
ncbi:actin-domain-containing protein [Rhodocollybia butyracea]|uniref:Actin-domain-containing protein n=1 Tax=Rhodocollybia butyracea TaxID=206335 RepID=A0A9P5PN48_9AGAR|nr:actin-domain-containing protein [Rhodocollybia butyracea]